MNIVLGLGENFDRRLTFGEEEKNNSVARVMEMKNDHIIGYISLEKEGSDKVEISQTNRLEPLIPITSKTSNLMRFVMVISGESGTGKSALSSMFAKQYITAYNNKRKIIRVSQKPISVDRNYKLLKDYIIDLRPNELSDITVDAFATFGDCLFIFDDVDDIKDCYRVIDIIACVGREYGISLIWITHDNSKLNKCRCFKELQYYITFKSNFNINNRMLYQNLSLTKKQIIELSALKQTMYMIDKPNGLIITERYIIKRSML